VGHLEALKAVRVLGFLADAVHGFVDDLGALGVVALGPVVACAVLAEDHVVWAEELTDRSRSHRVDDTRLEVDQDGPGDVSAARRLIVVNVCSLELQVGRPIVLSAGVNAVLVGDDLPELGSDLVTTLTGLNVYDFSHLFGC